MIQGKLQDTELANFPLGTLVVNVVGSFLLSFLLQDQLSVPPVARAAAATGFIGALTTFSTFALEADQLLRRDGGWFAGSYLLGNLLLGYAAVLAGHWLALWLGG